MKENQSQQSQQQEVEVTFAVSGNHKGEPVKKGQKVKVTLAQKAILASNKLIEE